MKITSKGIIDDGSRDLFTQRKITVDGAVKAPAKAVVVTTVDCTSGSVYSFTKPGFYYVWATGSSHEGWFTGSVPSASDWPGSRLTVSNWFTAGPVVNWAYVLTGSAIRTTGPVFVMPVCSLSGPYSTQRMGGTHMTVSGSSISMISDGAQWCICAGSGSLTLTGFDA